MSGLRAALDRRIGIEEYLVWSTAIAVLMFVPLRGSFQIGYVIVLLNALALLVFDHLAIHRNHMLTILALGGFSMIGAKLAGTPFTAPVSQILGITVMSVYFFSALTRFGLSLSNWMELYMRAAFALTVFALITWPIVTIVSGDRRLHAIYSEPSFFIYVTLPAFSYCVNCYVQTRRYGAESLIFLLAYGLADSTLGFFGLLLIAFIAYKPRLKGWQLLTGGLLAMVVVGGLYVASINVRGRVNEMVVAIATQDISGAGGTTFAFLSNVYVTSRSFLAHPLTGIGIGGYANAYDKYIGNLTGLTTIANVVAGGGNSDVEAMQLNRDDAASMFLRVAAELGLPGLVVLFGFLIVCSRVKGSPYQLIRNAILPYLIVRAARLGAYFTVELYFFVGIYLLNYLNYRKSSEAPAGPPLAAKQA